MNEIRTRFAPSPTGFLHIGGLRTALYSYAFAKSQGGRFILRIEDTDRNRFVEGATEKIYEILKTFGLLWDEGPFVQSERMKSGIYQRYAEKLVSEGHAYYCFCLPKSEDEIKEDREQKKIELRDPCSNLSARQVEEKLDQGVKPAIRLRVPKKEKVSFFDFVLKKEVEWETDHIDEVMLLKSDGFPTYHLAVVVDDAEMKISHIIRGRDWLPSTPVHLLLFKYLGFELPQIGHLTDILDPQGGKLSKRKGTVACEEFLADGYLPEAILNFIMLLGWAPKDNRELFTLKEFVDNFQKGELQVANPVFNRKKLDWFNGCYIRQKSNNELAELLKPFLPLSFRTAKGEDNDCLSFRTAEGEDNGSLSFRTAEGEDNGSLSFRTAESRSGIYKDILTKVVPLIKDRITKLSDLNTLAGFLFERPKVDVSLFGNLDYKEHLSKAVANLSNLSNWTNNEIQTSLTALVSQKGWKTGDFFMSFRIALSGSKFTPPITNCAEILGKEETITRLKLLL